VIDEKKKIADKQIDKQISMAYKMAFNTAEGKTVLEHLDSIAFYKRSTFDVSSPYLSAYNDGLRAVILMIHRRIELNLDAVEEEQAKMSPGIGQTQEQK
jgi:hypothetical protein